MLKLNVPETSNTKIKVSLNGTIYTFHFKYNTKDERWYIDILLFERVIASSLKIVPEQDLLKFVSKTVLDGSLFPLKLKKTDEPLGRNNFGIGKEYELVYFPPV